MAKVDANTGKELAPATLAWLKDGDVVSACAQACPAQAIAFGDLNDRSSSVSRASKQPRGYHVLADLGTHPRTTHLGKIRNPNSEMA